MDKKSKNFLKQLLGAVKVVVESYYIEVGFNETGKKGLDEIIQEARKKGVEGAVRQTDYAFKLFKKIVDELLASTKTEIVQKDKDLLRMQINRLRGAMADSFLLMLDARYLSAAGENAPLYQRIDDKLRFLQQDMLLAKTTCDKPNEPATWLEIVVAGKDCHVKNTNTPRTKTLDLSKAEEGSIVWEKEVYEACRTQMKELEKAYQAYLIKMKELGVAVPEESARYFPSHEKSVEVFDPDEIIEWEQEYQLNPANLALLQEQLEAEEAAVKRRSSTAVITEGLRPVYQAFSEIEKRTATTPVSKNTNHATRGSSTSCGSKLSVGSYIPSPQQQARGTKWTPRLKTVPGSPAKPPAQAKASRKALKAVRTRIGFHHPGQIDDNASVASSHPSKASERIRAAQAATSSRPM
jgi:hypothetical protein